MPNKPAAEKALRQAKKRTIRNEAVRKKIKDLIKKYKKQAATGTVSVDLRKEIQQMLDKAAKKGVIKKNTAGRKKSRLFKKKKK